MSNLRHLDCRCGRNIASHHDQFGAAVDQKIDDVQGEASHLVERSPPVRNVRGIGVVEDALVRNGPKKFAGHRQPPDAGIEYANRLI